MTAGISHEVAPGRPTSVGRVAERRDTGSVDESPGGYREWPARPSLRRSVACMWADEPEGAHTVEGLVLPDACIDIIWDGDSLYVAGPDTGPVAIERHPGGFSAAVRFRPGRAPGFLGVPSSAILDQRVALEDLWGATAVGQLEERLTTAAAAAESAEIIAEVLDDRAGPAERTDPLVDALVAWLRDEPASANVVRVAGQSLGVGERLLHRHCRAAVGYGPKMLERVLRFRRAQRFAEDGATLGAVAARAGYADHAHLVRECRQLSGRAPSDLFKTRAGALP